MKNLKVREILEILRKDGWVKLPQKATDHRQFKHPTKPGKVTVRGKTSDDVDGFLLKSIGRQAGIKF